MSCAKTSSGKSRMYRRFTVAQYVAASHACTLSNQKRPTTVSVAFVSGLS